MYIYTTKQIFPFPFFTILFVKPFIFTHHHDFIFVTDDAQSGSGRLPSNRGRFHFNGFIMRRHREISIKRRSSRVLS
jgi:hypothetical protein